MKRFIFIFLALPLLITNCTRKPVADFIASATEVGIGEFITFTNRSLDAKDYEWDFGDGYISTNYNVSHYYDSPGTYLVRLKAFGKDGFSIASLSISVLQTDLQITVEEYYEPYYLVPDIHVRLYPTILDWEQETNLFAEGYTNVDGVVTFLNVYPQKYYVDVYGPNHDNYTLASEDAGFIETQDLRPGGINYFTALVDYYPPNARKTENRLSIKQSKKAAIKLTDPRKASDKRLITK